MRGGRNPVHDHLILELSAAATEEQVLTAYRRLAKRHHPDRNPGDPGASDRFGALVAARDRMLARRRSAVGRAPDVAPDPRPADGNVDPVVTRRARVPGTRDSFRMSLADALRGRAVSIVIDVPCPCAGCLGTGRVPCVACARSGGFASLLRRLPFLGCAACGDRGRLRRGEMTMCGACRGSGRASVRRAVRFAVPPGACEGQVLRIRTPDGDIVEMEVEIALPPGVIRRGDDLEMPWQIPRWSFREGTSVVVTAPGGGFLRIRIPPGTVPGTVFRLPRGGLPRRGGGRGNLLVRISRIA